MKRGPVKGMSEGSAKVFHRDGQNGNERNGGSNDIDARAGKNGRYAVYGYRGGTNSDSADHSSTESGATNNYERSTDCFN
jgi:hypothetical protein